LHEGGERVVFPSKLYGICAAGRPVLFIGPPSSEIARVVTAHSLGLAFSRTQTRLIADGLRSLRASPATVASFSAAGRAFYEREGSIEHAAARWVDVLARPAKSGAAAS
jgi:colanic acid biosynthesis glycosyl transferase WcaI